MCGSKTHPFVLATLFSLLSANAFGVARLKCDMAALLPKPGPHAGPENPAGTAPPNPDLVHMGMSYNAQVSHLEARERETEAALIEEIAAGNPIYTDHTMVGASLAATRYLMGMSPAQRAKVTVISASPADKISPVFSGNPTKGGTDTGSVESVAKNQDEYSVGGDGTRVAAHEVADNAFPGQRGNNKNNGTSHLLHLAGLADTPMLFSTREVASEYRETTSAPDLSKWPKAAEIRTIVERPVTLEALKKQFMANGATETQALAKIAAMRAQKISFYDSKSGKMKEVAVLDLNAEGGGVLTFSIFSRNSIKAVGLTAFNVVVGAENHPFRAFANAHYHGVADVAAEQGGLLPERPRVGFADQNIHLRYTAVPDANTVFVELGPGDSGFINLQKRQRDVTPNSAATGVPVSKLMGHHLFMGRSSNMQPANTRSLFNAEGDYFGNVRLFDTRNGVSDVQLVRYNNGTREVIPLVKDGRPLRHDEYPRDARFEVTIKKPVPITDLKGVAAFMKQPSVLELIKGDFLPHNALKPEYLETVEGVTRPNALAINQAVARGVNPESMLKDGKAEALVKSMFFSGFEDPGFIASMKKAGKEFYVRDGDLIVVADYIDISQGYNSEQYINGVITPKGYKPIFEDILTDASNLPFPPPPGTPPQLVGRRLVGFESLDKSKPNIPHVGAEVHVVGAVNGTFQPGNLAPNSKPAPNNPVAAVGALFHQYFAEWINHNKSPFGIQPNLLAIATGGREFRRLLREADQRTAGNRPAQGMVPLSDLVAARKKAANPDRAVTSNEALPAARVVAKLETFAPVTEVTVPKEKVRIENALYHDLFGNFFAVGRKGESSAREIAVRFELDESGRLQIVTEGHYAGGKPLSEKLLEDLKAKPKLAADLANLIRLLGGRADLMLRSRPDGLVMAESVRFETPTQYLAQRIRDVTRKAGRKGFENAETVTTLLGATESMDLPKFNPDTPNDPASLEEVAYVARRGGIGSFLGVRPSAEPKGDAFFLAPGGSEKIYMIAPKVEIGARGAKAAPVGAVIVSYGTTNLTRSFRYIAGEQRMRDAGVETTQIVSVYKLPKKADGLEGGLAIVVKVADGTSYRELPLVDKPAGAWAAGRAFARYQTMGGRVEAGNAPDTLETRHNDFVSKQLAALGKTALADALRVSTNEPFFHGPTHGGLEHDKVHFSRNASNELVPSFSNFYESRGWGNVLFDLNTFSRGMSQPEQQKFFEGYVRSRMELLGEEKSEEVVRIRMRLLNHFINRINAKPGEPPVVLAKP